MAAGPFTVVATDLDGTLLTSAGTVTDRTVRALAGAAARGAAHVVVTGRPAGGCRSFLAAIGYRGVAVCAQGGQLYDADRHRLLWSVTLDTDVARQAVSALVGHDPQIRVAAAVAGLDDRSRCLPGYRRRGERSLEVVDDPDRLWTDPVGKLLLRHPGLADDELTAAARRVCGPEVTVMLANGSTVELLPSGVDKGSGLARAVEVLGGSAAGTVSFGDMPNDIPMLRWAGHGVAMGNAHDSVRAAADEVGPGNDDDGVARVLERLYGTDPARTFPAPAVRDRLR